MDGGPVRTAVHCTRGLRRQVPVLTLPRRVAGATRPGRPLVGPGRRRPARIVRAVLALVLTVLCIGGLLALGIAFASTAVPVPVHTPMEIGRPR